MFVKCQGVRFRADVLNSRYRPRGEFEMELGACFVWHNRGKNWKVTLFLVMPEGRPNYLWILLFH